MEDYNHFDRVLELVKNKNQKVSEKIESDFVAALSQNSQDLAQHALFEWETHLNDLEREMMRCKKVMSEMFSVKSRNEDRWTDVQEQWLERIVDMSSHMQYRYAQDCQRLKQLQDQIQAFEDDNVSVLLSGFLRSDHE